LSLTDAANSREAGALDAPEEHLSLFALVVYCQRLDENKFAVGLRLNVRVDKWRTPSAS
jgi:hypothetical protein